jgi:hypothetical protein
MTWGLTKWQQCSSLLAASTKSPLPELNSRCSGPLRARPGEYPASGWRSYTKRSNAGTAISRRTAGFAGRSTFSRCAKRR